MAVPAAFLSVVLIWATTPLAIKWSSEDVGFLFGATSRILLGTLLCLLLIISLSRRLPWKANDLYTYLVAGLGLWGTTISIYWGAQFIPSGLVSVLFGLTPVVTGVMAGFWLSERTFTPYRILGLMLGISGLGIIFDHSLGAAQGQAGGVVAVLLSVHIHSASSVWVKRIGAHLPALEITSGALLVALPVFLVTWLLLDGQVPYDLQARAAWSIVYLAVFGSAVGLILYFYVLRQMRASRVALITLIAPVIALLLGQSVNGESIGPREWIGTSVILMGLVIFQWGGRWSRSRTVLTPKAAPSEETSRISSW
jgi:drug/metabolite transporter (DMT)-like permease